ncbi:site-specific integrase [Fluviibacterium sp. DFM31]|uniref:Site-specific integrase n=1 Tax=Meridianimarinicoccus marinus TaxID=3231483 RepID=A0ABV3LB52_9RHOB
MEYFNNTAKNSRVAHTQRDIPYPSMAQAFHAFQAMPEDTDFARRDKALFAFFMLTCARDGAVASLKLKHINLVEGHVFQDARDVKTKNAKTINTWFFPVDPTYLDCFTDWVRYLEQEKLFGPEDALFPKARTGLSKAGGFTVLGLSREGYSSGEKLNQIIRAAFATVQLPEYTPHSFRKTLALYGDKVCPDMEHFKAWSMNMGHEKIATTTSAYMPVTLQRQRDLIRGLGK